MGELTLRPFHDTEIAFCARAECLKRLLVRLALVGGQRNFLAENCRCRLRSTTLDSEVREVLRIDVLSRHKAPTTAAFDAATIATEDYNKRADRVETGLHRGCLSVYFFLTQLSQLSVKKGDFSG